MSALLRAAPAVSQPRGGPSPILRAGIIKKVARSIQSNATVQVLPGLAGGCAKPIFDHAHEKSAKRQGDRGLMLRPLSSNLPYRSRREELVSDRDARSCGPL